MQITTDWLKKENACQEAVEWASYRLDGGKPLEECIKGMDRADWLLWLLYHSKAVNIRQLVKLACVAGRFSLRYIPTGEERPRKAYEAAEIWVDNPAKVAAGYAEDAARAARAAEDAARAAAWAAEAAAKAVAWAAEDAAGAAWAAAGAAEHKIMCNAIRAELKKPEFKKLTWPVEAKP